MESQTDVLDSDPSVDRPTPELTARLSIWVWQLPTLALALFLVALISRLSRSPVSHIELLDLSTGLGIILTATAAARYVAGGPQRVNVAVLIPVADMVGAALMLIGSSRVSASTVLIITLPAVWLAFEFGRRGAGFAIVATVVLSALPWFDPLGSAPTNVRLMDLVMAPLVIITLAVLARTLCEVLEVSQRRLLQRTEDLSTALTLAEDRLLTMSGVMEAIDACVVVLGPGTTSLRNQRSIECSARAGAPPGDPGAPGTQVFAVDAVTPVPQHDQVSARALRGETFSAVTEWIGTPGDQVAMVASSRQLVRADGKSFGTVLAAWDATALLDSVKGREDFLATVSHELRTPLTSIIGYLEILSDMQATAGSSAPQAARVLEVASRNAGVLLVRITQLLSVAQERDQTFNPSEIDVSAMVRLSVMKHEIAAAFAGVVLRLAVEDHITASVDGNRLEQALDNVITNAIKYAGLSTLVSICLVRSDSGMSLSVQDRGVGMSPDEQRQAFDRFYRAEGAQSSAIQGLGIGLGLVKAIIELHGGQVHLVSASGEGTTVVMDIPVKRGGRQDAHATSALQVLN